MKGVEFFRARNRVARARSRVEFLIVKHLFPQRPFITFRPGACLENVSLYERDGQVVILPADGRDVQIRNVRTYDCRVDLTLPEHRLVGSWLRGRGVLDADALVTVSAQPSMHVERTTVQGGRVGLVIPAPADA